MASVLCAGGCGKNLRLGPTSGATPKCRSCRRRDGDWWQGSARPDVCQECPRPVLARGLCSTHYSYWHRARNGRKPYERQRPPCNWCGVVHDLRPDGLTLVTEGLTHAQWAQHYPPSMSTAVALIVREPVRWRSRFEPPRLTKPWWRVIVQGDCAWCGESFTAPSTTGVARYCSDRCVERAAQSASRRRRGRFTVSLRRRRRLHERDRWTCGICNEPTLRTFVQGDPWSPTLDHIEPQTHALIPDHSDANLRTAHALCNSLRGDGRLTDAEVRELVAERRCVDVPA